MAQLILKDIVKTYNKGNKVINNFNLEVDDKEFLVLLGPSGCGKSTLLKIIAGLEEIDSGDIYMNGKLITNVEPKDRNIAMVFQNYALYPHMSVYKNIGINLILKKEKQEIIDSKVKEVAEILNIKELLDRKPNQLSGGQMQRVALARAMIRKPQVFLMDEPLSNLDAKLRVQTRTEIMKLYNRLSTTTIYVTHDQVEAMTMATKIVLLKDGCIQQVGTPDELYNYPKNKFVASFIGSPQMNFIELNILDGKIVFIDKEIECDLDNQKIWLGIRAEDFVLVDGDDFKIEIIENLGSEKLVYLSSLKFNNINNLVARCSSDTNYRIGDKCNINFKENKIHIFNYENEYRLL